LNNDKLNGNRKPVGTQRHIGIIASVSPGSRTLRIELAKSYIAYVMALPVLECILKDGRPVKCRVASMTESSDGVTAKIVPGVPRDIIAQLKKCAIAGLDDPAIRSTERYDPEELTDLELVNAEGTVVGEVVAGFKTKANGMMEVVLNAGGSMFLPVVPQVLKSIDWVSKRACLMPDVPLDGAQDDDESEDRLT
jgi:hypothetical protein